MLEVQTIVVGAGVVGLAAARALALAGREVVVLERASRAGTGASSRNSEVVHSGVYYPAGSLKARLCVEGRERLYAYCAARGIAHRQLGKLIVAATPAELPVLEDYRRRALANGAGEIVRLDPAAVEPLEPAVRCAGALHVAATGIVDSEGLMNALAADLAAARGEIAFGTEVRGVRRAGDGRFVVETRTDDETIRCCELVNAAGLHAPLLAAAMAGCAADRAPAAYFARGHYFALRGRSPFSRLVYPLADAAGLGVHVTLDLQGAARFGPDVEWVGREDYAFDDSRRAAFATAIRRYWPALDESLLQPAYVGVRPKIVPPGAPAADFRVDGPAQHGVAGLVQLFGIESPGLTASLAIGEEVVRRLATYAA
jgi:L-2-hydroxyglutarate oxidase LhgO